MNIDLNHIPANLGAEIDTATLKTAIANLRAVRESTGGKSSLGRKIKRMVKRLLRRLMRVEDFNLRVLLKTEMLGNQSWRNRVIDDLGGAAALELWDKHNIESQEIVLDPVIIPYVDDGRGPFVNRQDEPRIDLNPTADHETISIPGIGETDFFKVRYCKTDRDGLFRLAPITYTVRPHTYPEMFLRQEAQTWRECRRPLPDKTKPKQKRPETFQPIPLTPCELREAPLHNPHPEAPQSGGTRSTGIMARQVLASTCEDPSRRGCAAPAPRPGQDEVTGCVRKRKTTQNAPQSSPCPDPDPLLETRSLFLIPDKRGSP